MHAILLLATLAALLSAPLWYLLARRRLALLSFLDGFVLVSISGLVLLDVLPEAFADGGWWSLGFLALGLLGPTVLEHGLARARRGAHLAALGLAIVGLVLHSVGDGAALVAEDAHTHGALGLAIAIHSVPVGLVVWWLLYPVFGAWLPALALLAMCAGTATGYLLGVGVAALLGNAGWAWFQALIAGSILHVIFGRPHLDEDTAHHHSLPPYEGLGNLAALATLGLLALAHGGDQGASPLARGAVQLALVAAPPLLLAHALVGIVTAAGLRPGHDPGRGWHRVLSGLRTACIDAVDRSAAWALCGLGLGMLLLGRELDASAKVDAGWLQWTSLGGLILLYVYALLRRGGRAWLLDLLGRRPQAGS
ncbi:hypothetical protein [Sinimarinibacterium thermocellulolyticum]|uniref:Uncharacterized protein n=1 Tax=Sinimarinibacterium thermocellulolyticum TaxID=3170016 RepID=A0ABV2ADG2_9GAMM